MKYSIGIDFGTASGRVLIVNSKTGKIEGMSVCEYKSGVIEEKLFNTPLPKDFSLQDSNDYLDVLKIGIPKALNEAGVSPNNIIGIGVDFTSSTMIVTDKDFIPLNWKSEHQNNPHAYVKLWKHHGANEEVKQILAAATEDISHYLGTYGFNVSSEWMIPKILELKNKAPNTLNETAYIMEAGDWVVSKLVNDNIRSNCARGYKSFWNEEDGFDFSFFEKIDKDLPNIIREKFDGRLVKIGQRAGVLSKEMSEKIGLPAGIPVAPAIIDAHSSLLGIGAVKEKQLTMVMGTSTCHIMLNREQKKIPGISGSVKGAIIPDLYAYEAGQSAVGDLFQFVVNQAPKEYVDEATDRNISIYDLLEEKTAKQEVGETGLIALDWHNGNRSVLSDSNLSGVLIGQRLHTRIEDVYRAYMEATAFGTKMIMNLYEEHGMAVNEVFACGGLPKKNTLLMQIYADILDKPVIVSDSDYAPAIGAAILGAIASEEYKDIGEAIAHMKQPMLKKVYPMAKNTEKYKQLFYTYKELHDYFGVTNKEIMHHLHNF